MLVWQVDGVIKSQEQKITFWAKCHEIALREAVHKHRRLAVDESDHVKLDTLERVVPEVVFFGSGHYRERRI